MNPTLDLKAMLLDFCLHSLQKSKKHPNQEENVMRTLWNYQLTHC